VGGSGWGCRGRPLDYPPRTFNGHNGGNAREPKLKTLTRFGDDLKFVNGGFVHVGGLFKQPVGEGGIRFYDYQDLLDIVNALRAVVIRGHLLPVLRGPGRVRRGGLEPSKHFGAR
jgi:hypothetical protein